MERDDTPDESLVASARAGDRRALDELLARHLDRVHAICRRVLCNSEDAADATQEALIALSERLDRYDERARFTTWLYRVVTNVAIDEYRRRSRRPEPVETLPEEPAGDPADRIVARIGVDAALSQLAPEFRVAVALRDLGGFDYAQIGEILEIPPGTVRSRIARGRAALADLLGNRQGIGERHSGEAP